MKKVKKLLAVFAIFLTLECGYILYPERKGQVEGTVDTGVLVLDILWFLAGVIPGVVALVIDFSTGCIYRPGTEVRTRSNAVFIRFGSALKDAVIEVYRRGTGELIKSKKIEDTNTVNIEITEKGEYVIAVKRGDYPVKWYIVKN